ncbi:MAG: hypothetical protein VKP62_04895 [Candidatus Sericytochromatia bacterium]|nr:hypothetical protein [Candidatus Sericytochromatia bacterium]
MDIVITNWALRSYMRLRHTGHISAVDYWDTIRPDLLRLHRLAEDPKFQVAKFWSPAFSQGISVQNGYKMKWHQMGDGAVQLRLPVLLLGDAFLCEAYVKDGSPTEKRALARFAVHAQRIREGHYEVCGRLP